MAALSRKALIVLCGVFIYAFLFHHSYLLSNAIRSGTFDDADQKNAKISETEKNTLEIPAPRVPSPEKQSTTTAAGTTLAAYTTKQAAPTTTAAGTTTSAISQSLAASVSSSSISTTLSTSIVSSTVVPAGKPQRNFAFASFLAAPEEDSKDDNDDLYFVSIRMLIYRLLHDPETRTTHGYPFVVLVTEDVKQSKQDRLRKDGARVVVVKKITSDWIRTATKRWRDVLSKLHMFELEEYDKITFFDSDTVVFKRMDGIFDDPAAQLTDNLGSTKNAPLDEGPQPAQYIFAGNAGAAGFGHEYPPYKGDNLNAGCMVFKPSKEVFNYYMRVAGIKDRFLPKYPEQNLWAYVHRRSGNMPWKQMHYDWNINWVKIADYNHGIKSLHAKFWDADHDPELRDVLLKSRWQMEGWWLRAEQEDLKKKA